LQVREVSRIGILTSIAYLALSLGVLLAGYHHRHAYIMLYSALLLFPHSVALTYVASGAIRNKRAQKLIMASAIITFAMFVAPIFGLWLNWEIPTAVFAAISIPMIFASILAGRLQRGNIKLSFYLVSSSYIIYLTTVASLLIRGWPEKFSIAATALTFAYPVTLIYAVTVNSLPSTFNDKPSYTLSYTLPILTAIGSFLVGLRFLKIGSAIVAASTLIYIFAARMYKLQKYLSSIERLNKESPAYKGSAFFIKSHYVIIASIILTIIYTSLFVAKSFSFFCLLCLLHAYVMGFVSIHVFLHAPVMLPVVLKVKHKRRYTLWPLILALVAAAIWPTVWPISGIVSYILYVIAFCLDVRIATC